jgi:peptide-methionine (R)-S-oxide reductase
MVALLLMLPITLTDLKVPRRARRAIIVGGVTSGATVLASVALGQPASAARPRDDGSYEVRRTPAEWSAALSEQQYFVLREGGTEPKFSSTLLAEKAAGTYRCAGCDTPLFDSRQKFDSGTGWPSFANALPAVEVARHATSCTLRAHCVHTACALHVHWHAQITHHGTGRAPSPGTGADGGARRRGTLRHSL